MLHLGERGQLLVARLVSVPEGYKAYCQAGYMHTLLHKWATVYNYKYVSCRGGCSCDFIYHYFLHASLTPLPATSCTCLLPRYVRLMQTCLADALTYHQRGDDGKYGRRTGNKHVIGDAYVLPHLYGSLAQHAQGLATLLQHPSLQGLVQVRGWS